MMHTSIYAFILSNTQSKTLQSDIWIIHEYNNCNTMFKLLIQRFSPHKMIAFTCIFQFLKYKLLQLLGIFYRKQDTYNTHRNDCMKDNSMKQNNGLMYKSQHGQSSRNKQQVQYQRRQYQDTLKLSSSHLSNNTQLTSIHCNVMSNNLNGSQFNKCKINKWSIRNIWHRNNNQNIQLNTSQKYLNETVLSIKDERCYRHLSIDDQSNYRQKYTPLQMYIKYFEQYQADKCEKQLSNPYNFNFFGLTKFIEIYQIKRCSTKYLTIIKVFDQYIKKNKGESGLIYKYLAYQFIKYLFSITQKQFQAIFDVDSEYLDEISIISQSSSLSSQNNIEYKPDKDKLSIDDLFFPKYSPKLSQQSTFSAHTSKNISRIDQIVNLIEQSKILSQDELKIKLLIAKQIDFCQIKFFIPDMLEQNSSILSDYSQQLQHAMLDSICNINLCDRGIILQNQQNHQISALKPLTLQQIEDFVHKHGKSLYNVINCEIHYQHLQKLKLKSLNYVAQSQSNIILTQQLHLISINLDQAIVKYLDRCQNIENISLRCCIFEAETLSQLQHIKRFFSYRGQNSSQQPIILYLFKQSAPIFIDIRETSNTLGAIKLHKNIKRLQYLYVHCDEQQNNVILNLDSEFPDKLLVFSCKSWSKYLSKYIYNQVQGTEANISKIKNQLLNNIH